MARKKTAKTVNGRVFFYRISCGTEASGYPIPFDIKSTLETISATEFTDSGRYLTDENGDSICLWPVPDTQYPSVRFSKIRRTALPQIEESGNLSDLPISDESGLVESIHGVFFRKNIVGFEYNNHAPRITRLGYYLFRKARLEEQIPSFDPILRMDITEQLDRLEEIRLLEIKAHRGFASVLRAASLSLSSTFSATEELLLGGDEIAISMKIAPSNRRGTCHRFIDELKSIVRNPNARDHMRSGVVRGRCNDSGRVETVDLLRDKFIVDARVVRLNERTRAVDERSIIGEIEMAYEKLKDQLESATSVVP